MISKESMLYSIRNVKKSKARTFLTLLSIFVGIATIFIFVSFGLGLINYTNELQSSSSIDKITIQPKGIGPPGLDDTFALTDKDLDEIEKTAGVFQASGTYFKSAKAVKNNEVRFVWANAYDPEKPLILELFDIDIYQGRELRPGDRGKVVLGYNYLIDKKIFSSGLQINDKIEVQGKNFNVIGFYESLGNPQDDSSIYMTNEDFLDLYNDTKGYGWIIAEVDTDEIDTVIERVEDNLRDSRNLKEGEEDFFVQSFQDLLEQFNTVLFYISMFVVLIALISVVVSAINTANTMVTSVLERTKEIGVIKSIGARNSEIFKIFFFESGLLGFVAGVIGITIGFIITFIGSLILENIGFGFLSPSYSPWIFIGLITFATLTGAISGAWPAYQASKIKPVDALRYE